MFVFKTLKISAATSAQITQLCDAMDTQLPSDWSRDHETEQLMSRGGISYICYRYTPASDAPPPEAILFLLGRGTAELDLANIVPGSAGSLGIQNFNAILDGFVRNVAEPASKGTGVSINVTSDVFELTQVCSPETANALRGFSRTANKSTGSAHSSDFEKWADFIIAAHHDPDNKLDVNTLGRWLREEEGWDDEQASELVLEYEFGIGLLARLEERG